MKEIWVAFKGFEGDYEISNLGNVKSLKRNIILKTRIKQTVTSSSQLLLCKKGIKTNINVSREVYNHFAMPLRVENVVFHRDGNKYNSELNNLQVFENVSRLKEYLLNTGYTENPMKNSETVKKQLKTKYGK